MLMIISNDGNLVVDADVLADEKLVGDYVDAK